MKSENIWNAIYAHPEFAVLVRRRRKLVSMLMFVSMAVYFAIPVLSAYFPEFLAHKVFGAVNVGLFYLVGQYFFGAAIAVLYAYRLKGIDRMAAALVTEVSVRFDDEKHHD